MTGNRKQRHTQHADLGSNLGRVSGPGAGRLTGLGREAGAGFTHLGGCPPIFSSSSFKTLKYVPSSHGMGQDAQDIQCLPQGHRHKEPGHRARAEGVERCQGSGQQRATGGGLGPSHPAQCLGCPPEGVLLAGAGSEALEQLEKSRHRNRSWHPSSNTLQGARPASRFPYGRALRWCTACHGVSKHGDGKAATPLSRGLSAPAQPPAGHTGARCCENLAERGPRQGGSQEEVALFFRFIDLF